MAVLIRLPLVVRCCSPNGNGRVGNGRAGTAREKQVKTSFTRFDFPEGFIFGCASSAYQIEGAWNTDGKGPSIWDTYTHQHPERIADHSNGDIAIDSYHRYKEDVQLMKQMGCEAYRFSIAWTRILPRGNLKGGVNMAGIKHYSQFIDYIMSQGLKPFATLFHWDVPQALEDEYGGFLSAKIVKDFHDYANICFEQFGDRVKHWITINEPHTFCLYGYGTGVHAPGRCSPYIGNCSDGDSATEPYKVAHHLLLAHADAVKLYREKYLVFQEGTIGLSLDSRCIIPLSETMSDYDAAQRAIDFELGWFMDPLTSGQYPLNMKSRVRERLPTFTPEESQMLKGSYDFIGINYYTGNYATDIPPIDNILPSYMTDARAFLIGERNGRNIGQQAVSSWLYAFAQGLYDLLRYVKERYNNPPIYITENGMDQANLDVSVEEALRDNMRVHYFTSHLGWLLQAIKGGVDVRGHFAWTICDNFEWADGYTIRFGINYVDYKDNLKRYAKNSAIWYQNFLNAYSEYEKIDYTNYKELVRTTLGD